MQMNLHKNVLQKMMQKNYVRYDGKIHFDKEYKVSEEQFNEQQTIR